MDPGGVGGDRSGGARLARRLKSGSDPDFPSILREAVAEWFETDDDVPFMMQVYPIRQEKRALTGVPMVLNTSFNENEPVVCRPEEALDCFLRTKMDVLVMGGWFIAR